MEPDTEIMKAILAGRRPAGADLSGATLDGKRMPKRENAVPWDLAGANLRGAVLTGLDLTRSGFERADVSGAAFRNVSLAGADFRSASAAGAIFEDVNLAYACFSDSDLRGASFSFANLADIDFKGADLRGASVNGVRFSLNGVTHSLALKEALSHRYRPVTYPFAAGVSGDAFWLSYLPDEGTLDWGGYPDKTLPCGLASCGFDSSFVNELDVEEAWRRLTDELKSGHGVITPVHVGGEVISGSGFGGSEWVYVSDYDPVANAVRVRCLLGDRITFTWDQFVRNWCIHHPLARDKGHIVYTMCVMGRRNLDLSLGQAVLAGIVEGIGILGRGERPEVGAVFGIPAYDLLLRDLDVEPEGADEGCRWLGLGLRHHHGSRWAIRDFLKDACEHVRGAEDELGDAIRVYGEVMQNLASLMSLLPGSLSGGSEPALRQFLANRDAAAKCLRSARSLEEEALGLLRRILDRASPR